jgi:hypothetical protein
MLFQLMHGVHTEGGVTHRTKIERDKETGAVHYTEQPVIETTKDLARMFGVDKFRPIGEREATLIRSKIGEIEGAQDAVDSDPTTSVESEVAKAAKQGAVAIAEPPGKDVTEKFPEIQDETDIIPLKVYFKRGEGYFVGDANEILTSVALKRSEVVAWVASYRES